MKPISQSHLDLRSVRALILDADGTLWYGDRSVPGVPELFAFLREQRIAHIIATNNSVHPAPVILAKLERFGVRLGAEHLITCTEVTSSYLKDRFPRGAKVYPIGQRGLLEALQAGGYEILTDVSQKADAVVVGADPTLTYEKLKYAVLHIQRGAIFVGTNPDVVSPNSEGLLPEAGAIQAAVAAATGISPVVMGKPQPYLFQMAVKKIGSQPAETAVIGDRLDTDILGGHTVGLHTILVETGVDRASSISEKQVNPEMVVTDLVALVQAWREQLQCVGCAG
ncbi:MAG: HAD-IIA family hydrolase [Chloroflexi bacterium]|jgi:4-nitrophenyl phosphatase|nr:HAD-IIA family hydrolase [Anaerolineaceae bacterium]NMB87380.1 HAD-IIA family hydrolase [Chloroflexota bacterium]